MKVQKKGDSLSLVVEDKESLFRSYMPFIKNGGLFIPFEESSLQFGDEIKLEVHFLDGSNPKEVIGKVVWIAPQGAQDQFPTGIGLQLLGKEAEALCQKIEVFLGELLTTKKKTDTF